MMMTEASTHHKRDFFLHPDPRGGYNKSHANSSPIESEQSEPIETKQRKWTGSALCRCKPVTARNTGELCNQTSQSLANLGKSKDKPIDVSDWIETKPTTELGSGWLVHGGAQGKRPGTAVASAHARAVCLWETRERKGVGEREREREDFLLEEERRKKKSGKERGRTRNMCCSVALAGKRRGRYRRTRRGWLDILSSSPSSFDSFFPFLLVVVATLYREIYAINTL